MNGGGGGGQTFRDDPQDPYGSEGDGYGMEDMDSADDGFEGGSDMNDEEMAAMHNFPKM